MVVSFRFFGVFGLAHVLFMFLRMRNAEVVVKTRNQLRNWLQWSVG